MAKFPLILVSGDTENKGVEMGDVSTSLSERYQHAILNAGGIPLIMPIGLEKLIPSVPEAASGWGQLTLSYAMGLPCWLTPVSTGLVITEIQALGLLAGVRARQVAAGGVGGSEGAVILLLEGREEHLNEAIVSRDEKREFLQDQA